MTPSASGSPSRALAVKPARPSRRRGGADDPTTRALALATRYARAQVRSAHEVLAYLKRHQVSPRLSAHIVATCHAQGLVNDRACARLWAEQWARRGWAWRAIRVKLQAKGLPEGAIEAAEARFGGEAAETLRAQQLIEQRGSAHPDHRLRVARRLASRGFDAELIERLLDE